MEFNPPGGGGDVGIFPQGTQGKRFVDSFVRLPVGRPPPPPLACNEGLRTWHTLAGS